jgi:hypothetical protein
MESGTGCPTLNQRIHMLIKRPIELPIFRVRIAGLEIRENAGVRRNVLHRGF